MTIDFQYPSIFQPFFTKAYRYKVSDGGRGGGKTETFGRYFICQRSFVGPGRCLCTREIQKSIDESVYKVLTDIIKEYDLHEFFDIKKTSIRNLVTGYDFVFHGLRDLTVDSLKSIKGITECWVEEAHNVTVNSWTVLRPTIRAEKCIPWFKDDGSVEYSDSEIWISFNRKRIDDPVYVEFCKEKDPEVLHIHANWDSNPFFPEVLKKEKDRDYRRNPELARHVWEGLPLRVEGIVYSAFRREKNVIDSKEANRLAKRADNTIIGGDWGFDHPMAMVKIHRIGERYLITREYKKKEQIINVSWLMNDFFTFAGDVSTAIFDNARPELISFCDGGYKQDTNETIQTRFYPCTKYPGSVLEEINTINSLLQTERLLISDDCKQLINEIETWLWKENSQKETPVSVGEDTCRAMGYGIMYFENENKSTIKIV